MLKRYTSALLLIFSAYAGIAQDASTLTGSVKGFVYDKGTGEPMVYTTVFVEGTKIGVQTDVNGYFAIRSIPVGKATIMSTFVGYDTAKVTVNVIADAAPVAIKLFVKGLDKQLRDVEISGRKKEKQTQIGAGVTTITPSEIKKLPSSGGEPDLVQYLQVTPGVTFTGDQGGQLYIRGGSPSQTGILLDGVTIYNPFHSIGLYSVFETDAIRTVDVHSAGFGAEYGNRTSAILDVHTKDGNKNRISGKLAASPIMARAMLEGPLVKQKTEGGGSTTFLLSVKHSYLDKTSKSLYGGLSEIYNNGLPYSFTDLYGKVSFNSSNGSKLNLFGFNFNDKAQVLQPGTSNATADFKWNAAGGGLTFVVSPSSSDALINGKLAYSKYTINANEQNFTPRASGIAGFEGGINFTYFFSGYSQFTYGLDVSGYHTTLDYTNALGYITKLDRQNTLAGLYATFRKNFNDKLIFEPGIRFQYYSSISTISPEPRIGLKYNLNRNIRLKAAAGIYSQNVISTKSDRDIVNFFTGFLLSPDETITDADGNKVKTNLVRAQHLLGGIEVDVNRVEFNMEPWIKKFNQLIELNRNKTSNDDANFSAGNGKAYGVDLSAKYSYKRVFLWGVVSYQKITYTFIDDEGKIQNYAPPFDRRFNMNLVGSYSAGKRKEWELSARFNLGSPFPFTQTQGFYENNNVLSGGLGTNNLTQNGQVGVLYSNTINGGRLSWYHRMDLSVRRRFIFNRYNSLDATVSVTNVYDRNNIFYVNRLENVKIYQLPVFPGLNLTWNF